MLHRYFFFFFRCLSISECHLSDVTFWTYIPGMGLCQNSSRASASCVYVRGRSSGASAGRRTGNPHGCSGSGCWLGYTYNLQRETSNVCKLSSRRLICLRLIERLRAATAAARRNIISEKVLWLDQTQSEIFLVFFNFMIYLWQKRDWVSKCFRVYM